MRTRYSARVWAGFELVFRPWMARRLDGIHMRFASADDEADGGRPSVHPTLPDLPLLLMANHVSWWDGFLLREVHRALRPEAPLHVVMLEAELRRTPVFRWMGAVPLSPSPLGARKLARDLRQRLDERPDAVMGYFPQGRIWPSHRRPLGFRRGGAWLAGRLAPVAVVPVGLHIEPLTRPAPAAFISVGPPRVVESNVDEAEVQAWVTAEVDAILACTRRAGEDAAREWADGDARDRAGGAARERSGGATRQAAGTGWS